MNDTLTTSYYSINDGLYKVEEGRGDVKAFVMDVNGSFRQVGLARVYAEGTPMEPDEFKAVLQMRTGKRPAGRPNLRIVSKKCD